MQSQQQQQHQPHQQQHPTSLRPDATPFVPALILFHHGKQQQQQQQQPTPRSSTTTATSSNETNKCCDTKYNPRSKVRPTSARQQRRKRHNTNEQQQQLQRNDNARDNNYSINDSRYQSMDNKKEEEKKNQSVSAINTICSSSSNSPSRQRTSCRSKKKHPNQRKLLRHYTNRKSESNEHRKISHYTEEAVQVDSSDILSLQLSSTQYFPSLLSNTDRPTTMGMNLSTSVQSTKVVLSDAPTSDLSASTLQRSKVKGYGSDDTVWSKLDKLALGPKPIFEMKETGTTVLADDCAVAPILDDKFITHLVTLVRPPKSNITDKENKRISVSTSTDETKNSITVSTDSKLPQPSNNISIDPSLPRTTLSRRHPSIDKLRDRWWNLVREYQGHEKIEDRPTQVSSVVDEKRGLDTRLTPNPDTQNSMMSPSSLIVSDLNPSDLDKTVEGFTDADDFVKELFASIQHSDTNRVKVLLSCVPDDIDISSIQSLSPIRGCTSILDWTVHLNNAKMLRLICSNTDAGRRFESVIPLILAVELGHDECLQILLSAFGLSSLFTCRDPQGNTALHCSCISTAQRTTFSALLDCIISTTGYTKALLFKMLSSRNIQQQTPLHVAAMCHRADIIDLVLNHRSTSNVSMLTKLLALQDTEYQTPLLAAVASGSTDIVMSLQMWRGNNQQLAPTTKSYLEKDIGTSPCPLAWAVQHKNIEMVSLILEFNNPLSDSGYNLHSALSVAVSNTTDIGEMKCNNDNRTLDIIRILVAAGANPCATDMDNRKSKTAMELAALMGKPDRLAHLLHSYDEYLCRTRLQRRQDPKLQRQPESFFMGIESTENTERSIAGREALLISLAKTRSKESSICSEYHEHCCLVLYEHGVQLGPSDLSQLKFLMNMDIHVSSSIQCKASFQRLRIPCTPMDHKDQTGYYWSHLMSVLPWFENDGAQKCAFFISSDRLGNMSFALNDIEQPDVVIVCNDGLTLLAHQTILVQSEKLHAAIRFASMRDDEHRHKKDATSATEAGTFTLNIDLPHDICRQLLIHMYHGSILFDELPVNPHDYCLQLFELILVADEYICTSLIRECILRLLSSADTFDRCWCCYCQGGTARDNSGDGKYITRTYYVTGPSHLITADLALDVLAIAEHVNWCPDNDCDDKNLDQNVNIVQQPSATKRSKRLIDSLREVALSVAICNFGAVLQSQAFVEQLGGYGIILGNTCDVSHPPRRAAAMLLTSLLKDFYEIGRM